MHPDLPKLLDVQIKDRRLAEINERVSEIAAERAALDVVLDRVRSEIASATRTADDIARRRDDVGGKLEAQRAKHEARRQRLEQERNPRVAAQLMADVELGRSILTQEEGEWLRLSEDASTRAGAVKGAHERLATLEAEQLAARAVLDERMSALAGELAEAKAEREASASQLDRPLRIRYDRLRGSRTTEILVPAGNPQGHATCTACFTAIPRSRIGRLQAEGLLLDGCEMCGAIVYLAEVTV
ncbi:MAG: hypothetical protein V4558_11080 [Gemmatimonadota bacterium]